MLIAGLLLVPYAPPWLTAKLGGSPFRTLAWGAGALATFVVAMVAIGIVVAAFATVLVAGQLVLGVVLLLALGAVARTGWTALRR